MKKILLLSMIFIFALQMTAFAEIRKSVSGKIVTVESNYISSFEKKSSPYKYTVQINVDNNRYADAFDSSINYYFRVSASKALEMDVKFSPFTKKNTIKLDVYKKGERNSITFKKINSIGNGYVIYKINKKELEKTYDSERVVMIVPFTEGELEEIEIPKEIVDEWQYVMTADMRKIKKEILEN